MNCLLATPDQKLLTHFPHRPRSVGPPSQTMKYWPAPPPDRELLSCSPGLWPVNTLSCFIKFLEFFKHKTVFPCERKRHTACRVARTGVPTLARRGTYLPPILTGPGGGGTYLGQRGIYFGVSPILTWPGEGVPTLAGGTYLGVPHPDLAGGGGTYFGVPEPG